MAKECDVCGWDCDCPGSCDHHLVCPGPEEDEFFEDEEELEEEEEEFDSEDEEEDFFDEDDEDYDEE